jgi:hypothetical protein
MTHQTRGHPLQKQIEKQKQQKKTNKTDQETKHTDTETNKTAQERKPIRLRFPNAICAWFYAYKPGPFASTDMVILCKPLHPEMIEHGF